MTKQKNTSAKIIRKLQSKRKSPYSCTEVNQFVSDYVGEQCAQNANTMSDLQGTSTSGCSCGGSGGSSGQSDVDLVILIDSSTTMATKAAAVNAAAPAALEAAKGSCGANVRVTWLWVDGSKYGTNTSHGLNTSAGNFTQSHEMHLDSIGATGPYYSNVLDSGYGREQGADAIADISEFHDWKDGACRSILYISDTKLEGYQTDFPANVAAVNQAISVATANNVTVFAHRSDNATNIGPMTLVQVDQQYHDLCSATGGAAYTGGAPTTALYTEILEKAICDCGGGSGCSELAIPEIKPCISVSWGQSDCDCMESHDDEVVCITICNCYSNVTFKDVMLGYVFIKDENGKVPPLQPNGDPTSHIYPMGPICFGDIGPCVDGEENCVSRQFVILNRGAVAGKYQLELGHLCFDVAIHSQTEKIVKTFEICKD